MNSNIDKEAAKDYVNQSPASSTFDVNAAVHEEADVAEKILRKRTRQDSAISTKSRQSIKAEDAVRP
jgi:hypothetical protein